MRSCFKFSVLFSCLLAFDSVSLSFAQDKPSFNTSQSDNLLMQTHVQNSKFIETLLIDKNNKVTLSKSFNKLELEEKDCSKNVEDLEQNSLVITESMLNNSNTSNSSNNLNALNELNNPSNHTSSKYQGEIPNIALALRAQDNTSTLTNSHNTSITKSSPVLKHNNNSNKKTQNAIKHNSILALQNIALDSNGIILEQAQSAVKQYIGKEMKPQILQRMLNEVTRYYRDAGYESAQAFLPAQRVVDGDLSVYVLVPKLHDIILNNESAINDGYLDYLLSDIYSNIDQDFNSEAINNQLLKLSNSGIMNVHGNLSDSLQTDGVDLALDITDANPFFAFSTFVDNAGNKSTGRYRFGAQAQFNNLIGVADYISLFYARTNEQQNNYMLSYEMPISGNPTFLGFSYCYNNYDLAHDWQALGAKGNSYTFEAYLREFLHRDASSYSQAQFGLRYRALEDEFALFDLVFKKHSIATYAKLMYGVALSDNLFLNTNAGLTFGRLYMDDEYALMPEDNYSIFNVDSELSYRFSPQFLIQSKVTAQLASTALEGSEQFLAGGNLGLSAYEASDLAGDSGLLWQNSLNFYPIKGEDLAIRPHLDFAVVGSHGFTHESASSAGIAFSYQKAGFNASIDLSHGLGAAPQYAEEEGKVFFSFAYSFEC